LEDIGCYEEILETADTIEGNSVLKANYVTEKYGYNCFADDTGLEVEALNGAPGYSLHDMQVNSAVLLTTWINCKSYLINPIEMPNSKR
jgi:inosine/xanthosine triphosphate pyrophosphatase family protein